MVVGVIYCITSPSGKHYIGQTRRALAKRLKEHSTTQECRFLAAAFLKYGFDNMKVTILMECHVDLLNVLEKACILGMNTMAPNGYNIRSGGRDGFHCEDSRNRMRIAKMGENNFNYGKPRTEITRSRISAAKKGEKHHFYGQKLAQDHLAKLSQAHQKQSQGLPMYITRVEARPSHYCGEGYAIPSHPTLPKKYFTSKKLTMETKLKLAIEYLETA